MAPSPSGTQSKANPYVARPLPRSHEILRHRNNPTGIRPRSRTAHLRLKIKADKSLVHAQRMERRHDRGQRKEGSRQVHSRGEQNQTGREDKQGKGGLRRGRPGGMAPGLIVDQAGLIPSPINNNSRYDLHLLPEIVQRQTQHPASARGVRPFSLLELLLPPAQQQQGGLPRVPLLHLYIVDSPSP